MKYEIREMDWYKRRTPTPEPKAINVTIEGLVLTSGHTCAMIAEYDDGNSYPLTAHVQRNDIKGTWTVQGLDAKGHSVLVDITEI